VLAAEATAVIRLLDAEELKPGQDGWAQLVIDRPLPIVDGDHFVIRSTTETLGGGVIVDSHAKRLPRFRAAILEKLQVKEKGSPEDLLVAFVEAKGIVDRSELPSAISIPEEETESLVAELVIKGSLVSAGQGLLLTQNGWNTHTAEAKKIIAEYHAKFPTRSGIPKVELTNRLKLGKFAPQMVDKMAQVKVLSDEGIIVRLPEFEVRLNAPQQAKINAFVEALNKNPYSPPSELIPEPDLLNFLVEKRKVVKLNDSVVVSTAAYEKMLNGVLSYLQEHGKITLAEVRDIFQTSRKYAQALLEYLDGLKITRRVGDERVKY